MANYTKSVLLRLSPAELEEIDKACAGKERQAFLRDVLAATARNIIAWREREAASVRSPH